MENDQKVLIETAITTDDYFEARNALDEIIDPEGLVEVALNTKISNHAIMAVNRIKNGNVDLFAIIAKNAKDCEVAMEAVRRINKVYPEILSDIAQNASYEEVKDFAKSKIANQSLVSKDKMLNTGKVNKNSSKKELMHRSDEKKEFIQTSDEKNGIIREQKDPRQAKTFYETDHEMNQRIEERDEFLDMFRNDEVYGFLKIMFERSGRNNQRAFVLIAKNAYDRKVAMAAFERIDFDNNQMGLSEIARNAYGMHVAEKALENIRSENQMILRGIARYSNHLGVKIEALSRISGDYYLWAQKRLADIAKNAYDEVSAEKALEKISYYEEGLIDIAKNSEYKSVAMLAVEKLDTDQSGWIDIVKNANTLSVSRKAFEKISSTNPDVWVDIANNAKREYIARKAFENIDDDNQEGLVEIAKNSKHDSIAVKALSKLSDETLSKNPHLKDRKFENSKTEYKDYKYNPSYSSNRNSTRLDRMMR